MAVVYCGRTDDENGSADAKYQRDYSLSFVVVTDDPTHDAHYVGSHIGLPALWAPHPSNALARMVRLVPTKRKGDPLLWDVKVDYTTNIDSYLSTGDPAIDAQQEGQDPADRHAEPIDRLPDYTLTASNYTEAATEDADGNPVLNSAEDPFLPPPEIVRRQYVFTVEVNYTAKALAAVLNRQDCVNNNAFTIWGYAIAVGEAKQTAFTMKKMFERGTYYRYSHTILWRPGRNHITRMLNQGRRAYFDVPVAGGIGTVKTKLDVFDKITGSPVSSPVLLNSNGYVLASGAMATYRSFKFYRGEVAFDNL